jgi:hypothetical protein
LVTDEAQFADVEGDTQIGKRILEAQEVGVRVLRASGTLDRESGSAVERFPGHRIERLLGEHMFECYAHDRIDFEVRRIPGRGLNTKTDAGIPEDLLASARMVFEQWVADGRPYCLIRAAAMVGGSAIFFQALQQAFGEETICNGTGTKPVAFEKSNRDEKALKDPDGKWEAVNHSGWSQIPRVIFVVGRGGIGYDSPIRTHLYLVGVPLSDSFRTQLIGRVMRLRVGHPLCPVEWQRTSKIVFFTAAHHDGDILAVLFRTSVYITSLNILGALGSKINRLGHGLDNDGHTKSPIEVLGLSEKDMQELGNILLEVQGIWESGASEHDMAFNPYKLLRLLVEERALDYTEDQVKKFLVLTSTDKKVSDAISRGLEDSQNPTSSSTTTIDDVLLGVYERFCENTTLSSNRYYLDAEQIHLTADDIVRATHQDPPCTVDDMVNSAARFMDECGDWPDKDEEDPRRPGWTFGKYHAILQRPGASFRPGGLYRAIVEKYGSSEPWPTTFERYRGQKVISERPSYAPHIHMRPAPCPEVKYYPRAERIRHLPVAQHLTLWDADLLIGHYRRAEDVNRVFQEHGVEGFRQILGTVT